MSALPHRPAWAREPNVLSVRGHGDAALAALQQTAASRGLKIAEIVHVTKDGTDALYARGEPK